MQTERRHAEAKLRGLTHSATTEVVTASEVREILDGIGGLVGLLQVSEPALRSRFYEEVGLTGTLDPLTRSVEAVADLGVRKVRVGGGT
ncbi:MAG: hypothetical protein ACR2LQ_00970 [Acidimicrobiales bacterium]